MEPRSRRYSRRVCHRSGGGSGGAASGSSPKANAARGQLLTPMKVEAVGSAVEVSHQYRPPNSGDSNTKIYVSGSIDNSKTFTLGGFAGTSSVPDAEVSKIYKPMLKAALAAAKKSGATDASAPTNYFSGKVAEVVKKASSGTETRYGQEYYKFKL